MSGGRPWYETRKAFRGDAEMLSRAAKIDEHLTWWADNHPDMISRTSPYHHCGRVDLGRLSWGRFQPTCQPLTNEDADILVLPASTMGMPDFPDDIIPPHLLTIELSGLLDEDPGFEDFGGGVCSTQVYFVQAAFSGLIKIGIASDMVGRLASLRTGSPEPLFLLRSVPANDKFERYLHGLFEPIRSHGEWFYPHWSLFVVMGWLEC